MYKKIESLRTEVNALVSEELYNAFKSDIRSQYVTYKDLHEEIDLILKSEKTPPQKSDAIHDLLDPSLYDRDGQEFFDFATEFNSKLEELLNQQPELLRIPQIHQRFKPTEGDNLSLKTSKFFKRVFFAVSDSPRRFTNLFRKQPKPKVLWYHTIPFRLIAQKHICSDFINAVIRARRAYLINFTTTYVQLLIDSVDQNNATEETEKLSKALSKSRNALKKELVSLLDDQFITITDRCEKVGTIELGIGNYKPRRVAAKIEETLVKWRMEDKYWSNSFLLLFEEWKSDLELEKLCYQSVESFEVFKESQLRVLNESISPNLNTILSYIKETRDILSKDDGSLSQSLKKCNYKAQKTLDEDIIPKLLEILGSKHIINALARLENSISQGLKSMTFEFRLSKTATQYAEPIATSNIARISLYELIEFEVSPALNKKIDLTKAKLVSSLNEQITLAGDLDHMITFGLSTAIQQLQETDDTESALRVAQESLNRTEERVTEIEQALSSIFEDTAVQLKSALSEYEKQLKDLMVNENIRDMRIRITRAKAIQQTKAYRAELKDKIVTALQKTQSYILTQTKEVTESLGDFRQRFILTSKKQTASRAVSDFLSTSQERINSLPVIYRNLYKIEPLSDLELFVGRSEELAKINEAYATWVAGKMGSAALYGEKWSGLTTLLNYLQNTGSLKHGITRIKCATSLDTRTQFQEVLKKILPDEEQVEEGVAEKLNAGPKRIIIIEDIQNLYLRKSGGFTVIQSLLELISKTSSNIFWMTSCTIYTWEYFKKTIHIHEVFSYHISLKNPSEEDLSGIVQKRNRISGYKIIFEPDTDDTSNKKFNKLSIEQQQEHLRKRFFKNLIDFSESNISMALMFWLLSTKSVDQNRIIINSFQKPDLSFLEILSMEKILALHALILHDGLSTEQFAEVARIGHQAAFLNLSMMQEDGILIKKDHQYLVNPMVYRSVISLLKAKNLIYS